MDAFTGTEYTYWWAPLPTMRAWNEERIQRRFRDRGTQQFKVVNDETGRIVAWAKWDPPSTMKGLREGFVVYRGNEGKVDGTPAKAEGGSNENGEDNTGTTFLGPPEGSNETLYNEFFDGIVRMERKWGVSNKLALTHLCTSPDHHGRGIGSAMLQSVLEVADAESITTYLESLRLATPLYQRHGFVVVDRLEYDYVSEAGEESKALIDVMIREPKGGRDPSY